MNAHERADGSAPADVPFVQSPTLSAEPQAGGGCLHLAIFVVIALGLLIAMAVIFGYFGPE